MASSKTIARRGANMAKKYIGIGGIILVILALALGAAGGFLARDMLTKNDGFTLEGATVLHLEAGKTYQYADLLSDYKVTVYGQDCSDQVTVSHNIPGVQPTGSFVAVEGTYYIAYTTDAFMGGPVRRVVEIRVEGGSEA